jgi:hypothetical protein
LVSINKQRNTKAKNIYSLKEQTIVSEVMWCFLVATYKARTKEQSHFTSQHSLAHWNRDR